MASTTDLFKSGQTISLESSGQSCRIQDLLGGGGQGEVYSVLLGSRLFALKWYYPNSATKNQRQALELLVRKGPPTDRFLWPIEMSSLPGFPGFGYLMPLRESRFHGIVDVLNRRVDPTFRALVTAGLELVNSFLQLHSKGLCYCDISFGNVFFDPDNGDIMICDNDNVGVDGQSHSGVLGTARFMAPEVVCGRAKPSTQTDLYSLAVLLFYIFFLHHPLDGKLEAEIKCMDLAAMQQLYGSSPVFIFDPDDESNRPIPGVHENALAFWPLYPPFFREIFVRAFTDGLRDPKHGRVRESEWRAALSRLRDLIFYCPHCQSENFFHEPEGEASEAPARSCWACGGVLTAPLRLRIAGRSVVLDQETQIYIHHVDPTRRNDFSKVVACLVAHPTRPGIWGLKNLGQTAWSSVSAKGQQSQVEPGKSVTVQRQTRINFGAVEGVIV